MSQATKDIVGRPERVLQRFSLELTARATHSYVLASAHTSHTLGVTRCTAGS